MAAAGFRSAALALLLGGCTSINADGRTFAGTDWRIVAIDGQRTPGGPGYHMQFQSPQWRGGFGCNGMMGDYRLQGDQLMIGRTEAGRFFVGRIMGTERDCSDRQDGHFEGEAVVILLQPMRMTWRSARQLTLSNSAGSIALERIP